MVSARLQTRCPHCQARLTIRQELRGKKVKCPTCEGVLTISMGPARESAPSLPSPLESASLPPTPHYRGKPSAPAKNKSVPVLIGALVVAGVLGLVAVAGAVAIFVGSGGGERIATNQLLGLDNEVDQRDTAVVANSTPIGNSERDSVAADNALLASQIVNRWFEMRLASEEGEKAAVVQPGTPEYQRRVQRYLEGERLSKDILRSAIGVHGDDSLKQEFVVRQREFFDRYLLGIDPPEVRQSEAAVREDPRLKNLRWKKALSRYMTGPFFKLPEASNNKASGELLAFIQMLGEFAEVLNRWEKEQRAADRQRLDELNEAMFDLAIERLRTSGFYSVPLAHKSAEASYDDIIQALLAEIEAARAGNDFNRLKSEFHFVRLQHHQPATRDAEQLRQQWAELKDPSLKQERLAAEVEAKANREREQREQQEQRRAERDEALAAMRGRRNAADGAQGGSSRLPGGLADRIGSRRQGGGRSPSDGSRSRFGPGDSQGSRSQPPAIPQSFDGITLVIRGDGASKQKVDRLTENSGASLHLFRRSGNDTTALIKWNDSLDAFVEKIDFGTVVEIDRDRKRIIVEVTAEP